MFIETTASQDHDPNDRFEPIQKFPRDSNTVGASDKSQPFALSSARIKFFDS